MYRTAVFAACLVLAACTTTPPKPEPLVFADTQAPPVQQPATLAVEKVPERKKLFGESWWCVRHQQACGWTIFGVVLVGTSLL